MLLSIGPVTPYKILSSLLKLPTPTRRDFQILLVANTEKISVKDLKQSLEKRAKSIKN
jgi:hypothetical protein